MAYQKKKKKFHIETPAERAWIDEKLNAYKKWNKPYKGEIIYKKESSMQEFMRKAKYSSYDELNADAKNIVEQMNVLDKKNTWVLVSAKIIGQTIDDEQNNV